MVDREVVEVEEVTVVGGIVNVDGVSIVVKGLSVVVVVVVVDGGSYCVKTTVDVTEINIIIIIIIFLITLCRG